MTIWSVFTDGGSRKKDKGPLKKGEKVTSDNSIGASGVVWLKDDVFQRQRGYTCEKYYTNNMCELAAIMYCLRPLKLRHSDDRINIYTDSAYSINALIRISKPKVNKDLVTQARKMLSNFSDVHFIKVKGHSGNEYNEMVDQICTETIEAVRNNINPNNIKE